MKYDCSEKFSVSFGAVIDFSNFNRLCKENLGREINIAIILVDKLCTRRLTVLIE